MSRKRLSDDDVQASLRWFYCQPQSAPFLKALISIMQEIGPSETCALHAHNERRKFASDLISVRAEETDSDGSGKIEDGRKQGQPAAQRKSRRKGPAGW